jgi:adenylate cyclase
MFPSLSRLCHRMAKGEKDLHNFLFADISGYSRLTEIGGDEVAADLAIRFAAEAERIAREHGAEIVKRVGDAVMVRCDCAAELINLGLRLHDELGGYTPIHVGIHTGSALARSGDWWGATVNVAARVADAADAGQLLITEATRKAAGELGQSRLRALGLYRFKNISSPVRVYAVSRGAVATPVAEEPAPRARTQRDRAPQLSLFDRERLPAGALVFEG